VQLFSVPILSSVTISADFIELLFGWPVSAPSPLPGQFITVRVSGGIVPLLRRPFAISSFDPATSSAGIIFQRRGPATELLAAKKPGEFLDVIGPLGTSFSLPAVETRCVIVAGGIGLGPMQFLAKALRSHGCAVSLIIGCRSRELLPRSDQLQPLDPIICTDDGSVGFHGTTIDYLRSIDLPTGTSVVFFGCGPHKMLAALHSFAQQRTSLCQVSMEQVMACGVGACMGCVIKTVQPPGYARVCSDGPVFDSREVLWT
jgi:dihydroorotate dehydrogenase electron transfer subunit